MAAARTREVATAAQDALDAAVAAHAEELERREQAAAQAAGAHEAELRRLSQDLEEERTERARAMARADAAEQRAGAAEMEATALRRRAEEAEGEARLDFRRARRRWTCSPPVAETRLCHYVGHPGRRTEGAREEARGRWLGAARETR